VLNIFGAPFLRKETKVDLERTFPFLTALSPLPSLRICLSKYIHGLNVFRTKAYLYLVIDIHHSCFEIMFLRVDYKVKADPDGYSPK